MSLQSALIEALFIGHSLVGPVLPAMLEDALAAGGGEARVEAQVINGAPLRWNWENAQDARFDARAALAGGADFDAVVMTEALPLAEHVEWSDPGGHALKFQQLATRADPGTRTFLYETWHSLKSGTGAEVKYDDFDHIPWRTRIDRDLSVWEGIVAEVNAGRDPDTPPMRLIPAGQAMGRVHDAIAAGEVPGIDAIGALFHDDIHPNALGLYLVAMVHYASLTGESPEGLPAVLRDASGAPFDRAPTEAQAAVFQRIALETVRDHRRRDASAAPPARDGARTAANAAPRDPPLAMGLNGVNDWSAQQPFVNVFKTARPWIGHRPGEWGGWTRADLAEGGYLDADGWPTAIPDALESVGTLVLTDLPGAAAGTLAGRYRVTHAGTGTLELGGRARNVTRRDGATWFDFTPGPGPVTIEITATDPAGTGDHLRDIAVVRADRAELHAAGALFNPDWTARIAPVRAVRFMEWMETNDSRIAAWAERPRVDDYTWAARGVPLPVMVALANRLGVDPWFTLPHRATDAYMRRFAEEVRDTLDPARTVYLEYSNEVWNWQYDQADWAEAQARALWGRENAWVQFYGVRAARMARIWSRVFGVPARSGAGGDRLVRVVSVHSGWLGLEADILEAPLWVAEDPQDRRPPAGYFDAYAVTGYFGGGLGGEDKAPAVRDWIAESRARAAAAATRRGLTGAAHADHVAAHRYDHAVALAARELRDGSVTGDETGTLAWLTGTIWPHHARVARGHGLDMIMYEGGSHIVGRGARVDDAALTGFFIHLNYTAEMGALYTELLEGWKAAGGTMFNAFLDVRAPDKWGSWGALRHLGDANPRWDALMRFNRGTPAWW